MGMLDALLPAQVKQLKRWYGKPNSWIDPAARPEVAIIGLSAESLLTASSLVSRGKSVALTNGRVCHRIFPHPANTSVSHKDFLTRLGGRFVAGMPESDLWNDRGDTLYTIGWKHESLECFAYALACDGIHVGAWVNFGRFFMDSSVLDLGAAETCAKKALEVEPNNAVAVGNLGAIAFARHDLKLAERFCSHAIELNDDNFFAHYYLAGSLMQQPRAEQRKSRVLQHAQRCMSLIDQCPDAIVSIRQIIDWCRQ